jgi:hypothetical protein
MNRRIAVHVALVWFASVIYLLQPTIYAYFSKAAAFYASYAVPSLNDTVISDLTGSIVTWYNSP